MNIYSPSGQFGSRMAAMLAIAGPAPLLTGIFGEHPFAATLLRAPRLPDGGLRLAAERAYLVSVALGSGMVVIQDLRTAPAAYDSAGRDLVQFHIPCAALERHAVNSGTRFPNLAQAGQEPLEDSVIHHIAQCMLPLFERPKSYETILEGLVLTVYTRLVTAHGASQPPARGGLAPWQQKRAYQLLGADLARPVQLVDVARECDLSVSHFSRAFRHTEGVSPHQWVIRRRVDRARILLEQGDLPLAEIALDCGFADQSHFTRAFSRLTGTPPGLWRRAARAA